MTVQLRPHQQYALDRLANGKVLWGGVGTGKSLVAIAYYVQNESPKPLYIITTPRKRDDLEWVAEAAKYAVGRKPDETAHGIMTIDSWNNVGKYVDVKDAFFIFDEQRVVGKGAWVKNFLKIVKKNNWILLTATPGDTWMDYVPLFLAHGWFASRRDFEMKHVVYRPFVKHPQVDRYIAEGRLQRMRMALLVEMPMWRHTTRHYVETTVPHDEASLKSVMKNRWHIYEERPIREVAELYAVMRKVINSDFSRLQFVRELLDKHPKIIVFYNFDYELEILRTLEEDAVVAEWNGHKHEPVPDGDRWVYLVQYTAGAEGWNCTATDTVVFYSQNYSYKITEQAAGRIDRLNTPFTDLYYYVLISRAPLDLAIRRMIRAKKNFNEASNYTF